MNNSELQKQYPEEQNKWYCNAGNFSVGLVVFLLLLIFCKFPLFLVHLFPSGNLATTFFTITPGVLTLLSATLLLLNFEKFVLVLKKNLLLSLALGIILTLAIIHSLSIQNITIREVFFDLHPILIPLAVLVVYQRSKKAFILFFAALWILNLVHCNYQLIEQKECIGIPGNRNWNASFIVALTPVIVSILYLFMRKTEKLPLLVSFKKRNIKILFWILFLLICVFCIIALYKTKSRGAVLSVMLTGILFTFLELKNKKSLKVQKLNKIIFPSFILICISGIIISVIFYGQFIANLINRDVRLPLWYGAVNLFWSHIYTGVGAFAYENFFSYKMPVDLFLRDHYFASRYMHPHNQFLYIAGSYGIFGLAALLYLCIYPVVYFIKNYKSNGIYLKSIFFAYSILLIHAQLDKIAFQWPTSYLFLFFQGILWYKIITVKKMNNIKLPEFFRLKLLRYTIYGMAAVIFFIFVNMLYENIYSSALSRVSDQYSDQNDYKKALEYKRKAVKVGNFPNDIYDAGMLELRAFRNYPEACKYFKALEKHPSGIVVHRNMRIAECLIFMNRKKEALHYLNNESIAFPLSSLVLYNKILLENELDMKKEAQKTTRLLNAQLKFKGLKPSDMQIILQYPELDNKFHLVKQFRKTDKTPKNIKDKK